MLPLNGRGGEDCLSCSGALDVLERSDYGLAPAATAVSGRQANSGLQEVVIKGLIPLGLSLEAWAGKDCCKASMKVLLLHKRQLNKPVYHLSISQSAVLIYQSPDGQVVLFNLAQDCLIEVEIAALVADSWAKDFEKSPALIILKVQEDFKGVDGPSWIIDRLGYAKAAAICGCNRGIGEGMGFIPARSMPSAI